MNSGINRAELRGRFLAAEFFSGIGLVRLALEKEGFSVIFANDNDPDKHALYSSNFNADHFTLGDVRKIRGDEVPSVDLATASFPCTDLSLAGNRAGLAGDGSGMFWEFARVLSEMGNKRPTVVLLENVVGFATSHDGKDLESAIRRLNELGYVCDLFTLDAKWFVPQSRPRMFIVGTYEMTSRDSRSCASDLRPEWIHSFINQHPDLKIQTALLPTPPKNSATIEGCVERMASTDSRWWDEERFGRFSASLSPTQDARLARLKAGRRLTWATAYRRTRMGSAVWEIRSDAISGCLRTARGGSSKQAIVEAGCGRVRVRWMLPVEYARLQGAPRFRFDSVRENAALFGFGDAVCVPVIEWIARNYLRPILEGTMPITRAEAIALARANRARVDSLMRSEVDRDASRADD